MEALDSREGNGHPHKPPTSTVYRHKGSCRMIAIRNGPPTCNSSISTSSIRQVSQIMSLTTSINLLWLHSLVCSIPMDMKHLSGPNFISNIHTSPPHINSWVQMQLSLIFTFKTDSYATRAISVFLQVSVQSRFGSFFLLT